MRPLIFFTILILIFASCRSVRKTTVDVRHQKDSVAYTSVTTVDLDTTIIPSDTATLDILLSGNIELGRNYKLDSYGTYSGPFGVQEVTQEQGDDIILNYAVEKTPSGATRLKVKATTKPKEIITQNTTKETVRHVESSDIRQVENTKKVKGFSLWNLVWVVPVILIGIFIYLKRKTILKFLSF